MAAAFPTLRTGAVAQYPLARTIRFQTTSVRFLDGSRQRYRIRSAGLRSWTVKLNLLDQQELAAVNAFVEQQGTATFAFTDPVSGDTVSPCILGTRSFDAGMTDEMNAEATIVIEEIA
jgi:phage-related protein